VKDDLHVKPGDHPNFASRDPGNRFGLDKQEGATRTEKLQGRIELLQQRLYAEGTRSLLLVLQGLDGAGKDGVIRSVFTGVNPQGVEVHAFRAPSASELAHDYLWRVHAVTPERGTIGIFNRSHYEDIVTVDLLGLAPREVVKRRPRQIREWERMLAEEGTSIVKVFLHVSREEQGTRFRERLEDPEKRWKFRAADLDVRKRYDDYMAAYEEAIAETSTEWAPWYVVPADHNWVKALAVATLVAKELERMDPQLPEPDPGIDPASI
jgi:PPK2 family polyphosphate:nucleotide phosphotransferase